MFIDSANHVSETIQYYSRIQIFRTDEMWILSGFLNEFSICEFLMWNGKLPITSIRWKILKFFNAKVEETSSWKIVAFWIAEANTIWNWEIRSSLATTGLLKIL